MSTIATTAANINLSTLLGGSVADRLSVAQFTQAAHVPDYTVEVLANGNHLVKSLKIFRSGTFKDSRGDQHTWTPEHLAQMVTNFEHLRAAGTFVDVPVRADHGNSVLGVVGYIQNVRTDGKFLYADVEFTEESGWAKFESGTFRARSSEIGFYETNDEALFWPVVMGLAFVDVGAVEGLYARSNDNKFSLLTDDKDTSVDEATFLAACAYAQAIIDLELTDVVSRTDHEAAITAATEAAVALHSKGTPATFKVLGVDTADHAQVQTHIAALEASLSEASDAARRDFVNGLVTANKMAATQLEAMQELAVGMSDEQFVAFSKSYEGAPASALFQSHGNGVNNPGGEDNDADDLIAIARETVAMHRRSGMSEDQIKQTKSFKDLETLEAKNAGKTA